MSRLEVRDGLTIPAEKKIGIAIEGEIRSSRVRGDMRFSLHAVER
jgi:hypothetical protein